MNEVQEIGIGERDRLIHLRTKVSLCRPTGCTAIEKSLQHTKQTIIITNNHHHKLSSHASTSSTVASSGAALGTTLASC